MWMQACAVRILVAMATTQGEQIVWVSAIFQNVDIT
jgi:hypothetical protein